MRFKHKLLLIGITLLVFFSIPLHISAAPACSSGSCGNINQSCFDDGTCNPGLNCGTDKSGPIAINNRCLNNSLENAGRAVANGSTNPIPNPPVACNQVRPNEFQSLRPYQASATCTSQTANFASYCGSDLTIKDTITETYPGSGSCTTSGGTVTCNYTENVSKPIIINLAGAELPIMGNTQDTLTDADKVNNYVSWYLSGVINKKESPEKTDSSSIIDFSGPVARLLPLDIQNAQRTTQIDQAKVTRHDQIVACTKTVIDSNLIPKAFKLSLEKLGIGKTVPTDCTDGETWRLTDWNGDLSFFNSVIKVEVALYDLFSKVLPPFVPGNIIQTAIDENSPWNSRTPPTPWQDNPATGKPFDTLTYQKAYYEWRGKTCILIPAPRMLVCLENVLVPNKYSDIFPYIPLSSTEDTKGQIKIDEASSAISAGGSGVTVSGVRFSNQTPSTLFFSHMEESDQLGSLLQDTFVPSGADKLGSPTNIATEVSCKNIEVRSNEGDNLFASQLTGTLSYTASFSCTFNPTTTVDSVCLQHCVVRAVNPATCQKECERTVAPPPCVKDIYVKLSTNSNTPKIDDIWSRLVAGPMSVFKRIFPKTNTEGSVGQIIDLAGSTNITYSGTNVQGSTTDLKLPHIGGVSEYFLKGIQTALRPKGYGEDIEFANPSAIGIGDIDVSDICDVDCNKNPTSVDMTGVKERFIADGVRWGYGATGKPRVELYDKVVAAAKAAGVDPIFILALWIHESGASNYSAICSVQGHSDPSSPFCQAVQDFGINDLSIETKYNSKGRIIEDHFMDQLNAVVNLPGYYYDLCNSKDTDKCPIKYFFSEFRLGQCKSTDETIALVASVKRIYNILSAQTFACYPTKI